MGRLFKDGFETTFHEDGGPRKVLLPPKDCHVALWDQIESVEGTVQVLLDILGSDVEFYGRLFGTRHLGEYLSEPPRKEESIQDVEFGNVEFGWKAERNHYDKLHPDGDLELYLEATGTNDDRPDDASYGLDFVPLPSLAKCQIKIRDLVEFCEYGHDAGFSKLAMGRLPIRLIDMLGALVEEVSFHGSPKERDERLEDLVTRSKQIAADISSGKINEYKTLDDLKTELGIAEGEGPKTEPKTWTNELAELRRKVAMYEGLLHDIQMNAEVTLQEDKVRKLIANICRWSYAHRVGNGEYTEEEQADVVRKAFQGLRELS